MTTVTNIVTDAASRPLADIRAEIFLLADDGPTWTDDDAQIISRVTTTTDADGSWSLDLIPNSNIIPDNTIYQVVHYVPGVVNPIITFVVPDDADEHTLVSLATSIPDTLPSYTGALGDPVTIEHGGTNADNVDDALANFGLGSAALADTGDFTPIGVPAWQNSISYVGGQLAVDPSGNLVVRITSGTSRPSYDATEQALWFYPGVGQSPGGPAGGDLTGSYPNPVIGSGVITNAKVASGAAISPTKIALVNDGAFTSPTQRSASALTPLRRRNARYYAPDGHVISGETLAIVPGLMYFVPFHAERPITIDGTPFFWFTAPTGGHVRSGIYADDGQGEPTGAPLVDGGAKIAALTNSTEQTMPLSYSITTPGLYWVGVLFENDITGAGTVQPYHPNLSWLGGTAISRNACYVSGLTTTLPSSFSLTYTQTSTWPCVNIHVSSYT